MIDPYSDESSEDDGQSYFPTQNLELFRDIEEPSSIFSTSTESTTTSSSTTTTSAYAAPQPQKYNTINYAFRDRCSQKLSHKHMEWDIILIIVIIRKPFCEHV